MNKIRAALAALYAVGQHATELPGSAANGVLGPDGYTDEGIVGCAQVLEQVRIALLEHREEQAPGKWKAHHDGEPGEAVTDGNGLILSVSELKDGRRILDVELEDSGDGKGLCFDIPLEVVDWLLMPAAPEPEEEPEEALAPEYFCDVCQDTGIVVMEGSPDEAPCPYCPEGQK